MRGSPLDLGHVVVVGAGRSGRAAERLVARHGGEVVVVDDAKPVASSSQSMVPAISTEEFLAHYGSSWPSLIVASPGVRPSHPLLQLPQLVISEVELAYRFAGGHITAITGTNGKTTVTQMVHAMLSKEFSDVVACGNIGVPMSEVVEESTNLIVELSSFQLLHTREFHANCAGWTNFSPDHLDYHGSVEEYLRAKERIFEHQDVTDLRVLNADDSAVIGSRRSVGPREITFSLKDPRSQYYASATSVYFDGIKVCERSELRRNLDHEVANLLCASGLAISRGASVDDVVSYLCRYEGFEHRVEFVRRIGRVNIYNDSKATTPASVRASIASLGRAVLIVGGRNKGLDLTELGELVPNLAGVVTIGECATELSELFRSSGLPDSSIQTGASMRDAVAKAYEMAVAASQEVALVLSPGAASFDWYRDYAARGNDFKAVVRSLGAEL